MSNTEGNPVKQLHQSTDCILSSEELEVPFARLYIEPTNSIHVMRILQKKVTIEQCGFLRHLLHLCSNINGGIPYIYTEKCIKY